MIELTQTVLGENGNCWQTCVACILGVDPSEMPDQSVIERVVGRDEASRIVRAGYYNNPIQAYLRDHHGLTLASLWEPLLGAVIVTAMDGHHIAFGPTLRTPSLGVDHAVIARRGVTAWDPHPSRAGLLHARSWGVLAPFPSAWGVEKSRQHNPCVCPACVDRRECA